MLKLKRALFTEYGGFADKRIKKLEKGFRFIIDDRGKHDIGANGQLLSYFCMIFAEVISGTKISVWFQGNVPINGAVRGWITKYAANLGAAGADMTLSFNVAQGETARLRELADAVASITAPGAPRYQVPSYKYVCPRVAKSLKRFASTLDDVWDSD